MSERPLKLQSRVFAKPLRTWQNNGGKWPIPWNTLSGYGTARGSRSRSVTNIDAFTALQGIGISN